MSKARERVPPAGSPPRLEAVITGVKSTGVIEFAFIYGDPDLSVELVLPLDAFRDFCSRNSCRIGIADERLSAPATRLFGPVAITPLLSTV